MATVALDTNVISLLLRGDLSHIESVLNRIDTLYVPWAVYGELLGGVRAGSNPERFTQQLEQFLDQNFVERSSISANDTVPHYAEIYTSLKKKGTPVSPNDLWIAAECAKLGLPLYTLDRDFKNIPQLLLFS